MPLHIIRQDISKMKCDAIVNTTNSQMIGYSGVDLAIHEGAGAELDKECRKLAPLERGFAKITKGYRLSCKYIIHTSGPVWEGGFHGERAVLRSCYLESLKLAKKHRCKTVAFPLISSGSYGYPKDQVLNYAMEVISEFLEGNEMTVYLCVYDRNSYELSKALADDIRSYISDNYVEEHRDIYFRSPRRTEDTDSSRVLSAISFPAAASEKEVYEAPLAVAGSINYDSLKSFIDKKNDGFAGTLFAFIDEKGMTDVECYKRANIDKKVFSKIKCNKNYKPSKPTAVAFAISLRLNLEETKALLASAGLALSHSSTFDMIIEYFIIKGRYNIHEVNEALFEFDQALLGSL